MDATDAALRLVSRRGEGDWFVLVSQLGEDVVTIANEFADTLETVSRVSIHRIVDAKDAENLAKQMALYQGPIVVSGVHLWDSSEWAHLDQLRSRFLRTERTVLVIDEQTLRHIMQLAPNFSSWLGANVVRHQSHSPVLTTEERESRLAALRNRFGISDTDVVFQAESGTMPSDPEFVEWLVLLGRGELIHG
jgi:hypothetical protein